MDVTGLAVSVVKILSPYLLIGADSFVKEAGKDTYKKVTELKNWLWTRIKRSRDQKTIQTATLFESDPEAFQTAMEKVLASYLQKHPAEARELEQQMMVLNAQAPSKYNIQIDKIYGANFGDHGVVNQTFYDHDDD